MHQLYDCLAVEHDLRLVALALLLGALSAAAAVTNVRRIVAVGPGRNLPWLFASGVMTGAGVWGTHFVSMLGYEAPISLKFELAPILASLLVVITISTCGWGYSVFVKGRFAPYIGGAIVGAGIATMHYMSILSMDLGASLDWNSGLVGFSLAAGLIGGAAVARLLRTPSILVGVIGAGLVLLITVAGLHFGAMAAMRLSPDLMPLADAGGLSRDLIAVTVTLGVVPIVGFGLAAAILDRFLGENRRAHIARIRTLANATNEGLVVVRDGHILEINARFCRMLALTRDDLLATPLQQIGFDRESVEALAGADETRPVTCRVGGSLATVITVQVTVRDMDFDNQEAQIFVFRDVSDEEAARARIVHIAHHDGLTGLPNRLRFRECLSEELGRAWDQDTLVAVMFFDLDHFKDVNDVYGHAVGDALLVAVAEKMVGALPKHAIVSRLSGDEFAVVLPNVESTSIALLAAERVVRMISAPMTIGKLHIHARASGGVTIFPTNGEDPDKLMNQADLALYRAKGQGRNCICGFDPQFGLLVQERRMLEADLAAAIEDDLLDVHFQPQIQLGTGEVVGFEALVRWEDKRRGFVPPNEFISLAEETGQILRLGQWVLNQACREAVSWPGGQSIAVNVSPSQFKQGNLVETVRRALADSGLDPAKLVIEITEGVLIDDEARALTILRHLKELGLRLAIDDFGTGYSSLNYLRAFPFDEIKIDRTFISGIQSNRESQIIVQATIDLARELGMAVVAEGVESHDELAALGDQPEVVLQGFLLAKPMSRGAIAGFLLNSGNLCHEIARTVASSRRSA